MRCLKVVFLLAEQRAQVAAPKIYFPPLSTLSLALYCNMEDKSFSNTTVTSHFFGVSFYLVLSDMGPQLVQVSFFHVVSRQEGFLSATSTIRLLAV